MAPRRKATGKATAATTGPRRRKPSRPKTDVVLTIKMDKATIEEQIAEGIIDNLYTTFSRGYGTKPAVKISVGGKDIM